VARILVLGGSGFNPAQLELASAFGESMIPVPMG